MKNNFNISLLVQAITSILIITYVIARAYLEISYIDFVPINGTFQAFNPIRRLGAGYAIGQDFNIYLGLGLTVFSYLFYLPYYWLGLNDFQAAIFSANVLCKFAFLLTSYLTLRIFQIKRQTALLFSAFFLSLPFYDQINSPDNSLLALRCLLPLLSVVVLRKLLPIERLMDYCLLGLLLAFQFLWSPDFGIPCILSSFFILFVSKSKKEIFSYKFLINLFFLSISAILSLLLLGNLMTAGSFLDYLVYFISISKDQMWYFLTGWLMDDKIFYLSDIPQPAFILLVSIVTALILIKIKKRKTDKEIRILKVLPNSINGNYCLIFILLAFLGGAYLPQIGGHLSTHYFMPLVAIISFLVIAVVVKIYEIYSNNQRVLTVSLIIFVSFIYSLRVWIHLDSIRPEEFFYSEKLSTNLSQKYLKAEELTDKLSTQLSGRSDSYFSTYTTLIDYYLGKFNASGSDYIIHALGDQQRSKYLNNFIDSKPEIVSIINQEVIGWGEWNQRVNWDFYRNLYINYQPFESLWYAIFFKPRTTPLPQTPVQLNYQSFKRSNNSQIIVIDTEQISDQFGTVYFEADIDYTASRKNSLIPLIGKRTYLQVVERKLAKDDSKNVKLSLMYGLAPGQKKIMFTVPRDANKLYLEFNLFPEDGHLEITKFTPKVFYLADKEFKKIENLRNQIKDGYIYS